MEKHLTSYPWAWALAYLFVLLYVLPAFYFLGFSLWKAPIIAAVATAVGAAGSRIINP